MKQINTTDNLNRFAKRILTVLVALATFTMMSFSTAEKAATADTNNLAKDSCCVINAQDVKVVAIVSKKALKGDKETVVMTVSTAVANDDFALLNNTVNSVAKTADDGITDHMLRAAAPRVDLTAVKATDNLTHLMVNSASLAATKVQKADAATTQLFLATYAPTLPDNSASVEALLKSTDQLTNTRFYQQYGTEVVTSSKSI